MTNRSEGLPPGAKLMSLEGNHRIPLLMQLVAALSRATDPRQVLREFSSGFTRLAGPQGYISLSTRGLRAGQYRITRLLQGEQPIDLGAANPWAAGTELPVQEGGLLGRLVQEAFPVVIQHLELRDDPVVGDALAGFGSLLAVPLFDSGEPLNWAVMLRKDPEAFTAAELEEIILRANLIGTSVRSVLSIEELRQANRRIAREVEHIASIQRALLPQSLPAIPGVRLAASYQVHDLAGGDYYDLLPLRATRWDLPVMDGKAWDGPWGLVIADASGHGPSAAVLMAMLATVLHAYPFIPERPSQVLNHANHHLGRKKIPSSFVTAFMAIYNPATRELSYARAGHPPPLLMTRGRENSISRLDQVGDIPLGITSDGTYQDARLRLEPGQTIVLYTDGLTEALSSGGRAFGVDGIEESLRSCTGEPDCVIRSIETALVRHQNGSKPSDDQTILVMKVDG